MKELARLILCATLLTGGAAFAQAPILRQAPPTTDQQPQQPYPQGQPQYPQGQPQYPQGQSQYPQGQPQYPQGQQQYPQGQQQYPQGQPQYPQQGQPAYPPQAPSQYPPQAPPPSDQAPPPPMPPQQLDDLVQRIALYPDPLLAQVLTATSFWDQIPDAARWAQQHSYLTGDALSQAIQADNLPWDPSVLALLPFPSVLDMMARDPQWTGTLGNAVLVQRNDVMDAVQRMRRAAQGYGYLVPNAYDNVVDDGGYVEIMPVDPAYLYVPVYNPGIVFFAPRHGYFVGGAIGFGPRVFLAPGFATYGWFGAGFGWGGHVLLIDHHPWGRTFYNRNIYVHAYAHPYGHYEGHFDAHHDAHGYDHGHDFHHR